ncbi:MAG TPA: hypothetical protein VFF94_05745, partial [Novosphingobium sp.]|nr:hypothetical protein [Novosphingobium sp.]
RIAELALDARNRGKLGTQAVIARLEEVTRLDPAVFADWDALWSLYIDAGRLADARHAAQMAAGVAGNDRDRSVALANLGGVSEMEGQAAEARRAYQGAVDALRRLAGQGSGNSAAEGALAVGLGKLGDASMQMRDFAGADRAYTDGLGLRVELMKQDPPRYMPGVMWAARQAGEARRERGDLAGADKAYAVALHIFRLLQPAAGDRADVLRNGAFVLFGVSQLRQAQNDLQAARQAAEEALQLRRQLAAVDPGNAEAQRFLAESLAGLGDVLCRQNRLADARVSWQEAQAILDRIIANSPDNTPARFDAIHIQSAMADVPGSGVRWKDVVAQYEALDARGMLTDYHRYDLDQARERAEASGRRAP